YFIESLTNEVEAAARKLIEKIDAMGGSVAAIEQGFIQEEIAKSAYEYQRQVEKLKLLRSKRDNNKVNASLKALHEKAVSDENLMPAVLEAVENYCTLGE